MKCNPTTPYGIAKFTCSNFLQNIYNADNFPSTILRLFQVYGPSQGKNRIFAFTLLINVEKIKSFLLQKGEQYCDFCFIDDVVKAVFKAFLSKIPTEIINIGSAKPYKD